MRTSLTNSPDLIAQLCSLTILLKGPGLVAEWTRLSLLQPSRDAMEMECMIAGAPSHGALLGAALLLGGLTLNANLHEVVSADGTIVDFAFPLPHRNGVPLFDQELVVLS